MKGHISTPALLQAMLDPATGLRTDRVICQIVLMELVHTDLRFLLADTGIWVVGLFGAAVGIARCPAWSPFGNGWLGLPCGNLKIESMSLILLTLRLATG